jgi:hypothetical protein
MACRRNVGGDGKRESLLVLLHEEIGGDAAEQVRSLCERRLPGNV